jgi:hypothetical protein
MRLLLTILLLPIVASSQIVFADKLAFTSQTTNATAMSAGPTTFDAGKLYLLVLQTTGTANDGAISSTTLTWSSVATVGDATNRIQIFRCVPGSNVSGETVTVGTFGGGSTGYSFGIYEITGALITGINGGDAFPQSSSTSATTGSNPTINLSSIASERNTVIAFFSNNANTFGGTPEAGWSEIQDLGYATPTTGYYETRRSSTTDNTVVVTASSSTWIGIALEIQSSGRRQYNID